MALENAFTNPQQPPDEDPMMVLFKEHFSADLFEQQPGYALEERADGKADKEIEYTIYAKISNFAELEAAKSMEIQEQWEIKIPKTEQNAGKGSIRVRKTVVEGGEPVFTRATKIPYNEQNDKIEIPLPSNQDEFTAFKFLAAQGMLKHRYHFPILGTELVWEVDAYPKDDGTYHEWVKIDLEVKERLEQLPEFPIKLDEVILPPELYQGDKEEREKIVTGLYDKCFMRKNEFLSGEIKKDDEPKLDTGDQGAPKPTGDGAAATPEAPKQTPEGGGEATTDTPAEGGKDDQNAEPGEAGKEEPTGSTENE
jgi:hypothetical protein